MILSRAAMPVGAACVLMWTAACESTAGPRVDRAEPREESPSPPIVRSTMSAPSPRPRPVATTPTTRSRVRTETLRDVAFEGEDFLEAVRRVRALTGLPIITTPAARNTIEGEGLTLTLTIRAPLTVANLLDLMTSQSGELGWAVLDDVITIRSAAESTASMPVAYYDVRDLVFPRTEFIAPRITGIPTGDEDGETPRSGGVGEEVIRTYQPEVLVETIRIGTDPRFWDATPGASIELAESGTLIVRATPRIHGMIRRLLGVHG